MGLAERIVPTDVRRREVRPRIPLDREVLDLAPVRHDLDVGVVTHPLSKFVYEAAPD